MLSDVIFGIIGLWFLAIAWVILTDRHECVGMEHSTLSE
jgi:hypothetical protein